ncbi:hypothetical protein PGB90_000461 [Kerria lacca]
MAFPTAITRYLLFLCNLIFLVSALAVATVVNILVSFFDINYFVNKNFSSPPVIILLICVIICIVSFCGCCGVIKESRWCLYLFSVLLFVVVIAEIFAAGFIYSQKDEIANDLKIKMEDSMKEYNKNSTVTHSWNVLQHDFHCCGVKNATDWFNVTRILPHSCCGELPIKTECTIKEANKNGCFSYLGQFLQNKTLTLAAVVLGVGVVQESN